MSPLFPGVEENSILSNADLPGTQLGYGGGGGGACICSSDTHDGGGCGEAAKLEDVGDRRRWSWRLEGGNDKQWR